jgi:hypothetical protein
MEGQQCHEPGPLLSLGFKISRRVKRVGLIQEVIGKGVVLIFLGEEYYN